MARPVPPSDPDLDFAESFRQSTDTLDPLRVAVIGYGYWGPNVARNFAETEGAELAAVVDLDGRRLETAGRRHPRAQMTSDTAAVLADRSIDAVVVATPPASHFELARRALLEGKHVLVEKPIAPRPEQILELWNLSREVGRTLMVDHTFVYTGSVQKIRELVDEGQLGRLYYWDSVRVNLGLFQSDVSVLDDLAVHDLSIMDYVLEARPVAVSAVGTSNVSDRPANTAYLTLFFEDDFIAHFHVNWLAPVKVRRTLIGGDRRMIVYDDVEPSEKVKLYDTGITLSADPVGAYEMRVGYRAGDVWSPRLSLSEALRVEAQHFVDCVRLGRRPLTDAGAGYRVQRILEAAATSLRERGRPVEITWEESLLDVDTAGRPEIPVPSAAAGA